MTTYAHPGLHEPLDITAVLRVALAVQLPARPPGDAVPIRATHWPLWSHGLPQTVSYCDDRDGGPRLPMTAATEIDWSSEAIERAERLAADRERERRGKRRVG